MATKKQLAHLNMGGNQLQNAVIQPLGTAPESAKRGQVYVDTSNGGTVLKIYDGSKWMSVNTDFTLQIASSTVLGGIKVDGNHLTIDSTSGVLSVDEASTTQKGVIEIATDEEAVAHASEVLAVNPKQLGAAVDGLIKLTDLSCTATGLTYTDTTGVLSLTEGYVIPLETDIDAFLKNADVKVDGTLLKKTNDSSGNGFTLTVEVASDSKKGVVELATTTEATTGTDTERAVTPAGLKAAINAALTSAMNYCGSVDLKTDGLAGVTVPAKKGDFYIVTGGKVTISGVEWNTGDHLVLNKAVASGSVTANDVDKIDSTESDDIVKTDATQTLTNKTIDADSNTISNLETDNLKSGVLQTTVRAKASASDTALASEKAIATALEGKQDVISPQGALSFGTGANANKLSVADASESAKGVVELATDAETATGTDATRAVTPHGLASVLKSVTFTNPALTPAGGEATWEVTHNLGRQFVVVNVYETSSGEEVIPEVHCTSTSKLTIKINATSAISAGTYTVALF